MITEQIKNYDKVVKLLDSGFILDYKKNVSDTQINTIYNKDNLSLVTYYIDAGRGYSFLSAILITK